VGGRGQAAWQHGAVRLQARRPRPDLPQVYLRRLRGEAAELLEEELADAEDPEEYLAENVFWVPKEARWSHLQARAKQTTIGKDVDDAMLAIEA
jgi:type I restriction-modification system DNA methylase subunit